MREHLRGSRAEQVYYLRIEVLASARPGNLDGRVYAASPVVHLDGVGQVEQPHRPGDLFTANPVRDTLGVPAREDLSERIAHI